MYVGSWFAGGSSCETAGTYLVGFLAKALCKRHSGGKATPEKKIWATLSFQNQSTKSNNYMCYVTWLNHRLRLEGKNENQAYPELLHNCRCRFVVLGIEVGGRWSEEAASFITSLARTKTRDTPAPLRQAATTSLISRWTAFLTHAAMTAFAASLLLEDPTHHHNLDGEPPSLRDLLAQLPADPTDPSRLPPHPPWFVNGLCLRLCTSGDWPV